MRKYKLRIANGIAEVMSDLQLLLLLSNFRKVERPFP